MTDLQAGLFAMERSTPRAPADAAARHAAIDTSRSVLVEAPAGAGKTSLLTQRVLALLAEVESPEQILAITFTRAAAAEMRGRILAALAAAHAQPQAQPGEAAEMPLARRALAHAAQQGWELLQQPHRLEVETIDSLCLRLAHAQPLLARLGGRLSLTEDAAAMYARAARRTVGLLGQDDEKPLVCALRALLQRRDNNLPELERMLAHALSVRDGWMGVLPLQPRSEAGWDTVRREMEGAFRRQHDRVLGELCGTVAAMPELGAEWLRLAQRAAANLEEEPKGFAVHALKELVTMPGPAAEHRAAWHALSFFVLTSEQGWRRAWDKRAGFPAAGKGTSSIEKDRRETLKQQMKKCCEAMQAHPRGSALQQALCQMRSLPALQYTDEQWSMLLAVFEVLRRGAAELRLVFAEADQVDFIEIAQAARQVLADENGLRGLLESERKRHLLIDEFQDTSRSQYDLIALLLKEWVEGDERTAFVVGDPLQSIYSFREAEVALFHETKQHGLPCGEDRRHPCAPLHLTHNFRSHAQLVEELNRRFAPIFAESRTDSFVPSTAWPAHGSSQSLFLHPRFVDKNAGQTQTEAHREEAREIADLLQAELPCIEAARRTSAESGTGEYRVAVLVRTRRHLAHILPALRDAGVPFRAVELEPLAEQPEVHDLFMLLRALLHPAERVAWLSVLRAPWCGLSLMDLHTLVGEDDDALLRRPVPENIEMRAHLLSPDGQLRLARTWAVLRAALASRYSEDNNLSLAGWVERTWMALGGPACVAGTARENAEAFLALLDSLAPSGVEVLGGDFATRLAKLCAAPDTRVNERFGVQVMTMHKAKGLGFETVLLPGLERTTRADRTGLITMLLRARPGDPLHTEVLLAPVGDCNVAERDPCADWIRDERKARDTDERKRIFYVACTRARNRLHLFATLAVKEGKLEGPQKGTLLDAAWPALGPEIESLWAEQSRGAVSHSGQLSVAASAELVTATATFARASEPGSHWLDRLPLAFQPQPWGRDVATHRGDGVAKSPFTRPQHGSPAARVRGTALHALLEGLTTRFAAISGSSEPANWLPGLERAATRVLREGGYSSAEATTQARALAQTALRVARDPLGRWLLSPHPGALAESTWQTADVSGAVSTLRVDRSFRAGATPQDSGEEFLWIVDYKTGHPVEGVDEQNWLAEQKEIWRAQLEAYGAAVRAASHDSAASPVGMRYGLYFPELLRLLYWGDVDS